MDVIDRCIEGRKTVCVYLAFQADSTLGDFTHAGLTRT